MWKICLKTYATTLALLLILWSLSYAANATRVVDDVSGDSNGIHITIDDSNDSNTTAVEEKTDIEDVNSDILSRGKAITVGREDPNDPDYASGKTIDYNSIQERLHRRLDLPRMLTGLPKLTSNKMIAFYIAIGLALVSVVAWFFLRKTLRTRLRMRRTMKKDPDIDEFLIIFNLTPKVLYFPTIIASVLALCLMYLQEADLWFWGSIDPKIVGSIWFIIFILNFLVEEYCISITVLLTSLVSVGFLLLWLHLVGWVADFLRLFKHFALSVNATGYLLVSIIGVLTILISWLKGLFYYVTITPNYMNLQEGPTETGEQISREDYNTKVDTGDFVERLLGFGKIVITFKDRKRQPISVLVWRIKRKAQLLEKVRTKFIIDHPRLKAADTQ